MTLLEELQARIRAKSSASSFSFRLAAAARLSDAPRPEGSSCPPLGLSSRATVQCGVEAPDETARSSMRSRSM